MKIQKVNRINVLIKYAENKHIPNIDIPISDMMRYYKFGGLSTNESAIRIDNIKHQVQALFEEG